MFYEWRMELRFGIHRVYWATLLEPPKANVEGRLLDITKREIADSRDHAEQYFTDGAQNVRE